MKRIAWAVLVAVGIFHLGLAYAEDVRIGYVDLRKVMNESKSGQKARAEIEKMVKERRERLTREDQELKDMQQTLEKNKLLMSESQRAAKQKEFEDKLRAFQQARADAQREIEQKDREFASKALPQIRDIIRDVAKEQKLTFVFEKNDTPVLYAPDGPDLTDKVIQRFNAKRGD